MTDAQKAALVMAAICFALGVVVGFGLAVIIIL